MPGLARRIGARFRALLGSDAASVRQGLAALLVSSGGDLLAGLTLGAITNTLSALPGLLVLVPAAIGMRGNIFGALGSRLGTAIHTGTFSLSRRADTIVGQNVVASMALTLSISFALAVLAKGVAIGFGLARTISIADFVVISMVGGAVSSVFVLLLTLGVAAGAVRFGWDMDNVAAPLVTAAGDMVTLPSLFLATYLVGLGIVTPLIAADLAAGVAGLASPGVLRMIAVSLIGGFIATAVAVGIVYYGAIAAYRLGLDPDNHGIPLITSSMDLVGAFALILAIVLIGLS